MQRKTPFLGLNLRGSLSSGGAQDEDIGPNVTPPAVGSVSVLGACVWCTELPAFFNSGRYPHIYAGVCEADHGLYGEPAADHPNPLRFLFWSQEQFATNQPVSFDIAAAPYGSYAKNVQSLLCAEDYAEAIAKIFDSVGQHEDAASIREQVANLYRL